MPTSPTAPPGGSRWSKLRQDIVPGLINAVVSVPDGLASAALVGVNPVYGLYTSITAPIAGSALVSAQLMQVFTTTASALAAAQAIAGYPAEQRDGALFLLMLLVGLFLAIFGALKLGRLVRFVSHAVMTPGRLSPLPPGRPPHTPAPKSVLTIIVATSILTGSSRGAKEPPTCPLP